MLIVEPTAIEAKNLDAEKAEHAQQRDRTYGNRRADRYGVIALEIVSIEKRHLFIAGRKRMPNPDIAIPANIERARVTLAGQQVSAVRHGVFNETGVELAPIEHHRRGRPEVVLDRPVVCIVDRDDF